MMENINQINSKNQVALEVKGFSKRYQGNKKYAVKDINFKVEKGSFHGFIGANGAGKTTTIKSLIGAYAKYDGEVFILGHKNTTQAAKELMGYIPEEAKFPKTLTTIQYITHMANMAGMKYKDAKRFAKKTLDDIGLSSVKHRNPNSFSSGQKKKVLLSQALVNNPKVIIMDEPAANLDPRARSDFFQTLKNLQKQGVAIFISSHILTELSNYVDSVTIVDGGKIVFSGTTEKLSNTDEKGFKISPQNKKDIEKIAAIAKSLKLISKKDEDENIIKIITKTEEDQFKILKKMGSEKIKIKSIVDNKMTLSEAYEHYVKLGSVDTEGKDTRKSRELNKKEVDND